jgi:8-oxo-dGTP pyrophosphatase MutT (NUDIX family)
VDLQDFRRRDARHGVRLGKWRPDAHDGDMDDELSDDARQKNRPGRHALPVSCGTLVINSQGDLLLCHVTGTARWDIPKGMQDAGESTLQAAMRELFEEAGIVFDGARFDDLGGFAYRRDKRLHLYRVRAHDELGRLEGLKCTSFYAHPVSGRMLPEADGYRWAGRSEIGALCWPRMGQLLLSLDWER